MAKTCAEEPRLQLAREALSDLLDYLKDPANPKPGKGAKNVLRKARAALDELEVE